MDRIPHYMAKILTTEPPARCSVIPGTLPVVAFGDPHRATVATLGINPSRAEFLDRNGPLRGDDRRLPTCASLKVQSPVALDDAQIATAVAEFRRYFHVNPYSRWFDPLDGLLRTGLGVSYRDDSACHLDIVPWATDPVWGKLKPAQRASLLDASTEFLFSQLQEASISLLVVNGQQVWNVLRAQGLITVIDESKMGLTGHGRSTTVRRAVGPGRLTVVGWSLNLQSSFGVHKSDHAILADWLSKERPRTTKSLVSDQHLAPTMVTGKSEFTRVLRHWFETSSADTLGDTGTYGGKKLLRLSLGDGRVVILNADTTRAAVGKYLSTAETRGIDAAWRVIANSKGVFNKVDFTDTGVTTPGWYCYVTPASPEEDLV